MKKTGKFLMASLMALVLFSVNSIPAYAAQDSNANIDWWYENLNDEDCPYLVNSLAAQAVDIDNLEKLPAFKKPEPSNKEDRVVIVKDCLMKSQNEVLSVDAIAGDGYNYYDLWQTLSFFYPSATAYTKTVQANRTTLNNADSQSSATSNLYLSVTVDCDKMPGKKYVFSSMGGSAFVSTDTNPQNKSRVGTLGSGKENEITDIDDYDYVVYKHNLYISGRELAHLFNLTGFDSKCDIVNPITRYILTQRYWDAVARGTEKFPEIISLPSQNTQTDTGTSQPSNTGTEATSRKATDPDIYNAAPSDVEPLQSVLNQTPLKTKWYPAIGQKVRWGYAVGNVTTMKDGRVQCKWTGYYDYTGIYYKKMTENLWVKLFLNIPDNSSWIRISEIRAVS